jgi:hypothetical protein
MTLSLLTNDRERLTQPLLFYYTILCRIDP